MRVVIAPDSFKGTLDAPAAAAAMADGWRRTRPDDEVVLVPLSDGGDGLLRVLAPQVVRIRDVEVTGPRGRPRPARVAVLDGDVAAVEVADACGLAGLPAHERDPLTATSAGVGDLLLAARASGAGHLLVGLGGSATVDGGIGALARLGTVVEDDTGRPVRDPRALDLERVARGRWPGPTGWDDVRVSLLADVRTTLEDAAATYGPQKGATTDQVRQLARGLAHWADVVERDLTPGRRLRDEPGTGAAGGLAFGLVAGLGARIVDGAQWVARSLGLEAALAGADVLVVGEGQLDPTSFAGKVVGNALDVAAGAGVLASAVVGRQRGSGGGLVHVEEAAADGPGTDPAEDVAAAAARLAATIRD